MYECLLCNTTYDLSNDHYKYISEQVEEKDIIETIIICPGCMKKRIVGGEEDIIGEEHGIMMFGRKFNSDDSSRGIKEFEGIIVEKQGS